MPPSRNSSKAPQSEPDPEAIEGFISEVAALARSVDPMLAAMLGERMELTSETKRWNAGRKSGLEFCLTMLGYARVEAERVGGAREIDRAISYIVLELARFSRTGRFAAR